MRSVCEHLRPGHSHTRAEDVNHPPHASRGRPLGTLRLPTLRLVHLGACKSQRTAKRRSSDSIPPHLSHSSRATTSRQRSLTGVTEQTILEPEHWRSDASPLGSACKNPHEGRIRSFAQGNAEGFWARKPSECRCRRNNLSPSSSLFPHPPPSLPPENDGMNKTPLPDQNRHLGTRTVEKRTDEATGLSGSRSFRRGQPRKEREKGNHEGERLRRGDRGMGDTKGDEQCRLGKNF